MGRQYPTCSIVIRAFNEERHIGRLLEGIARQTIQDVQIILVDSGSTDATLAIAFHFPVEIVEIRPEEFTFGRSLNLGCAQARGEFIVIASAHVYPVYPDWLEQLLKPFDDPQVALAYGRQRGNHATKFSESQHFAKMFPERSNFRQDHPLCNNANAAIRRTLWETQPYDEELSGLEDMAWANWAISQGYYLAYSAEAEVVHVHNETPRQVYNRYRREAMALRRIQPGTSFGIWDFIRLLGMNIATDLWQAGRERRLLREARGILWFRTMQFWGTYQGFRHKGPVEQAIIRSLYYPSDANRAGASPSRMVEPIDYAHP